MSTVAKLFDEKRIERRVDELAVEIARALPREFLVIGILKGSFVFMADLVRALDRNGRAPMVEFLRLASYGHGRESSGRVRLVGEFPAGVSGADILLVDDIADTGRSLGHARDLIQTAGAARIWSCALIDKPSRREVAFQPDFTGFTVEDVFVVGYGIDYAERYRHLPFIGVVQ